MRLSGSGSGRRDQAENSGSETERRADQSVKTSHAKKGWRRALNSLQFSNPAPTFGSDPSHKKLGRRQAAAPREFVRGWSKLKFQLELYFAGQQQVGSFPSRIAEIRDLQHAEAPDIALRVVCVEVLRPVPDVAIECIDHRDL